MVFHFVLLAALAVGPSQPQTACIGAVEFFGTSGIDVEKVRSLLPVREHDEVSQDQVEAIRGRITQAIAGAVGPPPTDVAVVCCDERHDLEIYIGLGGRNGAPLSFLPTPNGTTCIPGKALTLYAQAMQAVEETAASGNTGEDDSQGYALAAAPSLRAKQLAMHKYALTHPRILQRALRACARSEDRRAAATLLGYAGQSGTQIRDLIHASRDSDEGVRNNAVRALSVLARSNPRTAAEIPADRFIEMLNSGIWGDRNKGGMLLLALTRPRPPKLLRWLGVDALPSLIEMARWRNIGHAYSYKVMLGRIAGFDEARIEQLIYHGKVDEIVAAVEDRH